MKLIKRSYLNDLIDVIGTPDIKVITGVRRSGKSKLLEAFFEYVVANFQDANVINIDFNKIEFEELQDYHALNKYITSRYQEGKKNFVIIDEIQMCLKFEKTINGLHSYGKYDIYITWFKRYFTIE
ncbi:MAG: AAA family ATPase [Erysipelotrichaceae bacterium]|nr:AAA family ATPase [Erysipelotrichaceae bacterium]